LNLRLLVLGANGTVGRVVVDQAIRRGHEVTALVRAPQKLGETSALVTIVRGDALDPHAVASAVRRQDAVVYALGAGNVRTTTLFSESTRILLDAMQREGVRRLVCVTGVGAGDTKGHGGFVYDRIVYPLFTKAIYADKDRQEAFIRDSGTDWTLVRPAPFRKHTLTEPLSVVTQVDGIVLRRITPHEVGVFVVDEAERNRYVRQAVFIGHP
jgi:putative NADH-flavin reductase